MSAEGEAAVARRAIGLLELTDLSATATAASVERLCGRAVTPHGAVAAVVVAPRFVGQARRLLAGTSVRVGTVGNFPEGGEDTTAVVAEASRAAGEGADEFALVLAYRAFREGRPGFAETQVRRVRSAIGDGVRLAVILETGELVDPGLIRSAAALAFGAGADAIGTATGRAKVNASIEAVRVMLPALRPGAGLSVTGGLNTVEDVSEYLALADAVMGSGWPRPGTFRLGADDLLDTLTGILERR